MTKVGILLQLIRVPLMSLKKPTAVEKSSGSVNLPAFWLVS